ncbi:MAG: hypothetical protein HOY76_08440 [Streptomyces sp.]|nr:hypothetical protein [Streptomyces sp.]
MKHGTERQSLASVSPLSVAPRYAGALKRIASSPVAQNMAGRTTTRSIAAGRPLSAALVLGMGRLTVDYDTPLGSKSAPLNLIPTDTYVSATGKVTAVTVNGTDDAPRAFVVLTSTTGEQATVDVSTDRYLDLYGWLVEGETVEVRGTVRRPYAEWPPLIDAAGVVPRS